MKFLNRVGWLNLMLVFIPVAIILKLRQAPETWIFATSCAAIIPLAGLMGRSTELLAERVGPGIGGLLNASFGNAAELIIAIFALKRGLIDVVKASITGSILGNVLLVLGASFLAGGMKFSRQTFNATAAGISATMLALAAVGLLVPAAFHAHLVLHHAQADELNVSLEIAIVLFAAYLLMLVFSLKTHKHLYTAGVERHAEGQPGYSEVEGPWPGWLCVTVLLVATTLVGVMSELLVGAIEETRQQFGWTEVFVGVVVVAIVGNAAEHSSAIMVAMKNRMELSFQIAVGSGLQVAMFVAPVLVFVSFLPGFPQRMDLVFTMLEVVAVVVSVMIVGLVANDGESNWMEGLMLLAVYGILGIAFYHLPEAHAAVGAQ